MHSNDWKTRPLRTLWLQETSGDVNIPPIVGCIPTPVNERGAALFGCSGGLVRDVLRRRRLVVLLRSSSSSREFALVVVMVGRHGLVKNCLHEVVESVAPSARCGSLFFEARVWKALTLFVAPGAHLPALAACRMRLLGGSHAAAG